MLDAGQVRELIFELMAERSYMPMRKRSLAKALEIPEEDYSEFRRLLDTMVEASEIAEMKRGKFGLPRVKEPVNAPMHFSPPAGKKKHQKVSEWSDGTISGREGDEEDGRGDGAMGRREDEKTGGRGDGETRGRGEERFNAINEKEKAIPKGARVGRIEVKRGGMGFLLSDPPGNDIFIAPEDLGGALHGDQVAVELKRRAEAPRKRGKFFNTNNAATRPTGRVIKIIERAHPRIVGTFYVRRAGRSGGYVVPDTKGMFSELDVLTDHISTAKDKDKVAVELVEASETARSGAQPTAKIVMVFGPAGDPTSDIEAIIENFNIKREFPPEVLAAAEAIDEEIPADELAQRTNYEHPVTFTIDPHDAKDHDDAVAIRKESDGRITLLVHIADVSYYVQENSVIDIEARERATSVYLPGTVFPMLPPKLSTNMCSLKEGKLRLAKTVSMTFGKNLTMQEVKIERSVIRSAAFMTYDQVKAALDDNQPELARTPEIFDTLVFMKEFAQNLRQKRLATGSLELEMPESKLLLDEKLEVKGWATVEHHWAHELIEDMMLAANRAVAEYLVEHELPGLFRTHEEPDPEALKRFAEFVNEFGISLRPPIDRLKLKSVLDRVKGKEYAHTVNLALLTSLKQAKYSAECMPHFALNFARYLHFTSPIRRYPDLIVHRALDSRFEPGQAALPAHGKKRKGGEHSKEYFDRVAMLKPLATHCSLKEREADGAEEEVRKFRQMQFLRRNMKEAHPGLITGVRDFGLFVELQDCFVEGRVRVQSLGDEYFEYYENQHLLQGRKTRRSFQLGDKVEVRIVHMDLGKKQVELEIV